MRRRKCKQNKRYRTSARITKVLPGTGRTDGQTDGRTECNAICGTLLRRRAPHNEPPRALATSTIAWVRSYIVPSLLGRCKQKQRGLRRLLCRWPSVTEWEMYTSLLRAPVSETTYTVSSGTLNSTIPYHTIPSAQLYSLW